MLEIENLSVNYGHVQALRGVSLHVDQGEIITLIGGNGAGKTSTLMAISNLVPKAGGAIRFKGKDITRMPPHRIVKMGICHVPEGRRIFPAFTVKENFLAGTIGNPSLTKKDKERLLEEAYALFPRLKERWGQSGGSLSGGEQQMLAIARGMMMDPELMLLDELKIKKRGKTILLIEQNAGMALQVADRGYVLVTGSVALEGSGPELLVNPEVRKAYLGM